jgi:4-carboxymuconolactone decarboxylase
VAEIASEMGYRFPTPTSVHSAARCVPACSVSPDRDDAICKIVETLRITMNARTSIGSEELLRGLAACDEGSLRSVLAVSLPKTRSPQRAGRGLSPPTSALIHLAALLATGGSTTSLRWAVELAVQSGAQDEDLVDVLVAVAGIVGSARVVAEAPRLALAIGYDIEVEGWDGC